MTAIKYLIILFFFALYFEANAAYILEADLAPKIIKHHQQKNYEVTVVGEQNPKSLIVAKVEGPKKKFTIDRKYKKYGMWFSAPKEELFNTSTFYKVFSNHASLYSHYMLPDIKTFQIDPVWYINNLSTQSPEAFEVIKYLVKNAFYSKDIEEIEYIGNNFFRFKIFLPATAPVGPYIVHLYATLDGRNLKEVETLEFEIVNSSSIEYVFDFFRANKLLYSVFVLIVSVMMGVGYGAFYHNRYSSS